MANNNKRTPKNYDGTNPTGKKLNELLPDVLRKLSKKCNNHPHLILSAWNDIVGGRISKMSRAVAFESGILKVLVQNSTLYSLLIEHEKPKIIAAFKTRFPKVKFQDISFKIG